MNLPGLSRLRKTVIIGLIGPSTWRIDRHKILVVPGSTPGARSQNLQGTEQGNDPLLDIPPVQIRKPGDVAAVAGYY